MCDWASQYYIRRSPGIRFSGADGKMCHTLFDAIDPSSNLHFVKKKFSLFKFQITPEMHLFLRKIKEIIKKFKIKYRVGLG